MKAIIYGPSKSLQFAEIDKPVPADDEVLLQVRAAAVNPLDCHFLRLAPWQRNLMYTALKARVKRSGVDVAGVVEAVGRKVTRFAPGDAVFGSAAGSFAEYACTPDSGLAIKPADISFEMAASSNMAGRTALQGMRDIAAVRPGQTVLVNGASGGVGTFAVQIAKWMSADVTGVCSTGNMEMVLGLGADRVIDYTHEDFSKRSRRFDVIYDLVGDKRLLDLRAVLTEKGKWVGAGMVGSTSMAHAIASMAKPPLVSLFTSQTFVSYIAKPGNDDLAVLAGLIQAGTIKPVIDRTYSLQEVPEAVRYVAAGHARGKVVITVAPSSDS